VTAAWSPLARHVGYYGELQGGVQAIVNLSVLWGRLAVLLQHLMYCQQHCSCHLLSARLHAKCRHRTMVQQQQHVPEALAANAAAQQQT
jgi:hypothetical protein